VTQLELPNHLRRRVVAGGLAFPFIGGCSNKSGTALQGALTGANHTRGHWLRDATKHTPRETQRARIVIVGGGVAGLSAAWWLKRQGFTDFVLLELEDAVGGNARGARNTISPHPLGAHYIPLPGPEARLVRQLLGDLGVIEGDPHLASPRYREDMLVHAPQDRLFMHGLWQEGLQPRVGATERDEDEFKRFEDIIARYKLRRSGSAKAFCLPRALSAQDADLLALDKLSASDWLAAQGLKSPMLRWLLDYACRDDYGATVAQTSAWAALHYFAARDGEGLHAEPHSVLTWPEGNGYVTGELGKRLSAHVRPRHAAYRVEDADQGLSVDCAVWEPATENTANAAPKLVRYLADQVLWAAPEFVLARALPAPPPALLARVRAAEVVPWVVTNLSLREHPAESTGAPLAWDNVLYDSPSLGYVVATHQTVRRHRGETVLTHYLPITEANTRQAREAILKAPWQDHAERALAELERPHPDIRKLVTRADVQVWGHAMRRPVPGSLWPMPASDLGLTRLHLAHSDASGLSLFEEANYCGVQAAMRALANLGGKTDGKRMANG
jgi:hypothetical protein